MVDLAEVADLFEVRGDIVRDLDLLTLLRARTRPMLFACRPVSEGGRWDDADPTAPQAPPAGGGQARLRLRGRRVPERAARRDREKAGRGLIVSHHDLRGTPDDLDGLYAGMAEMGADIVKIAVTPRSIADVGRLLAFAGDRARGSGPPLVPIALGPMGQRDADPGRPLRRALHLRLRRRRRRKRRPGQLPVAVLADLYRVREITSATRVYGVLGSDVERSLSPVLHNRAFAAREARRRLRPAAGGGARALPRRRSPPSTSPASA